MQGVGPTRNFSFKLISHRKQHMHYITLGRTGLRVSVAGLGTGGFSRMGLKTGKTEDEAARLVLDAVELGVNFIDTAPPYGTEGVVGRALKSVPRDKVVVAAAAVARRRGRKGRLLPRAGAANDTLFDYLVGD
jgi:aryl-alcohol dehydrogenase-like predicted oxidoreductase